MTRYGAIRQGDSHTGGGVMLEASGFPIIDKNHCLMGDRAFCPTHGGSFPLVSGGAPDFMVMGRMAVYEPAKLACGLYGHFYVPRGFRQGGWKRCTVRRSNGNGGGHWSRCARF